MTRRRRMLQGVVGVGILIIALPYVVWHPRQLNHAGFEQIQIGMTQAEVEQLLGGPSGIYYPTYPGAGQTRSAEGYQVRDATESFWYDDARCYEIWFTEEGKVAGKHQRSYSVSDSFTCRHTAMLWGVKEPTPLEPRRYIWPPRPGP